MDTVVIYDGPDACPKCLGWKRIANGEEGASWKHWAELLPPSNLSVVLGLVYPVECPRCRGTGRRVPPITDEQIRTAIDVLKAYVDSTLSTDLCDELDEAIEAAWDVLFHQRDDDNEAEYYQDHGDV